MARMSVDDALGRDPRIDRLAHLCGWTKRETVGCLQLDIWPLCYDRVTPNIPVHDLEIAAARNAVSQVKHEGGFVGALIESKMGRRSTKNDRQYELETRNGITVITWPDQEVRDRIYVHGAAQRIAYILKKRGDGHSGGVKSGESRGLKSKQCLSTTQALLKHETAACNPTLTLTLTPTDLSNTDGPADAVPTESGLAKVKAKTDKAVADKAERIPDRAWRAADYLRELVLDDDPSAVVSRQPWGDHVRSGVRLGWADEIRLMVERDKRTYEQIAEVLRYLFKEQTGDAKFIVQSADALRDKWDRIQAVRRNTKPEKTAQRILNIPIAQGGRR